MTTQSMTQKVLWQDLKVRSEVDTVLEIAQQEGWEDCEIFGSGDMITQPLESAGWKLIPADQYEYSIPDEGVHRVHQVINAGVRIRGIIIADDERRTETPPSPAQPKISLEPTKTVLASIGKALLRLLVVAGAIAVFAMFGLTVVAVAIFAAPLLILSAILGPGLKGVDVDYDPKLVILVDDGNDGTVWVSILTWYD